MGWDELKGDKGSWSYKMQELCVCAAQDCDFSTKNKNNIAQITNLHRFLSNGKKVGPREEEREGGEEA